MELDLYVRFILALLFVIGLFIVVALVMRRLGVGGMSRAPSRQRRLVVVDALVLDPKRRLVLIRRDDTEHLVLLGAAGDVVVETGIKGGFRDAMAAQAAGGEGGGNGPAPAEEEKP